MADTQNMAGLDGTHSVSALGLRWAALRGMLASPLITTEDQRPLRDELVRELGTIEQEFRSLPSRNAMEVSAKIDIAKSALQERLQTGETWLIDLLESVQSDLHAINARTATASRSTANLTRSHQARPEEYAPGGSTGSPEAGTPSAA